MRSFADEILVQNLAENTDGFLSSSYYHKDAGGKLKAGPFWDFNIGMGTFPLGSINFSFSQFCILRRELLSLFDFPFLNTQGIRWAPGKEP